MGGRCAFLRYSWLILFLKRQVKKDPWYTKIKWLANIVRMPKKNYAIQVSALMACFIIAGTPSRPIFGRNG